MVNMRSGDGRLADFALKKYLISYSTSSLSHLYFSCVQHIHQGKRVRAHKQLIFDMRIPQNQ